MDTGEIEQLSFLVRDNPELQNKLIQKHLEEERQFESTELYKQLITMRKRNITRLMFCPKLSNIEIKEYNSDSRFKVFKKTHN